VTKDKRIVSELAKTGLKPDYQKENKLKSGGENAFSGTAAVETKVLSKE